MYDVDDFIRNAREELSGYEQHEQRFEDLLRENEQRVAELRARQEDAWRQLGMLALPHGDEASVAALVERFRLPGLQSLAQETASRRAAIEARVAEIDATPLYAERERRRLRAQTELEESGPLYDYAQAELQKLRSLRGMEELVQRGWGTPRYPHRSLFRFFNGQFLNDWKHADEVVKALRVPDFAAAASQYRERLDTATVMGDTVQRLRAELGEIDRLENERAQLLSEREALPAELQERVGRMLGEMLQTRGKDGVRDFPVPEDALRVYAAIEGVQHQQQYLEELSGRIRGDLSGLMDRAGRLREETRRYEGNRHRYRNKRFTDEQFGKRFGRSARYGKIHSRYSRAGETIYVFNDYDRGATFSDFLWWDLMTDGRMDGNYIPEVAVWRHHHPDYSYVPDRDVERESTSFFTRDDS
jgi:hypothetical protein